VGESGSRYNNRGGSTEGSVGNLQVEDLSRNVCNNGVWRRKIYPRAREGDQLAYRIAGSEGRVWVVERWNQGKRLLLRRVGQRLEVRVEETKYTRVEGVVSDGTRKHVILQSVSSGPNNVWRVLTPRSWACWTSSDETFKPRFVSWWPM
jgi:hypothetical protein